MTRRRLTWDVDLSLDNTQPIRGPLRKLTECTDNLWMPWNLEHAPVTDQNEAIRDPHAGLARG